MKKSRFNRFAPDFRSNTIAILLAIAGISAAPVFAAITPGGTNTYNGSTDVNGLTTGGNWTVGSPNGSSGAGSYTDLLFTGTDGSTFTSSGGTNTNIYAESYNVTNGSAYTLQLNSNTSASFQTGSTSSTGTGPSTIAFTNSVSGVEQDLIYLSNGSSLTFNATNGGTGSAAVMNLRQAGNFNIGTDSILTVNPVISGAGLGITITGGGTTIFNGANTYSGNTVIAGGTLEIAGTNASASYLINGSGEPVLKLSNLNALPATSTLVGSNSYSLDGTVDLAVAGDYTLGMYNRGHIKFTASSGGPTSLHFTEASLITSGANSARVFTNDSANLSIVFDSTLDIGGDGAANVTITGAGDTTVTGDLLSTGAGVRSLIKDGNGSLTLNGDSAHTGTTTVSGGSLVVNGNISTSSLTTVQTGATLGGSGTVSALTIDSGGTLAPGNSPGILNVNGALNLDGALSLELNGATPGVLHDQVNVTGTVTLSGLLAATVGYVPASNDLLFILLNDGNDDINGTFSGLAQGDTVNLGGYDWLISYTADSTGGTFLGGNDVALMAVPEPGTALLGTLGLLALLRRRRA